MVNRRRTLTAGVLLAGLLVGCAGASGPSVLPGGGSGGSTSGSGANGGGGASSSSGTGASSTGGFDPGGGSGGAPVECESELSGTIRDFLDTHPDFESAMGDDKGIVQSTLGADLKPVYAGNPTTPTTHGKEAFDQWYRDVDGVNVAIPLGLGLVETGPGVFTYDNGDFFPIDGQGFGNQGRPHNYHFTYEIHAEFTYQGGEVFTFTGDDDLFTFINGRLAIDLGGVHGAESQTIDLDAEAALLGITVGETYPLDFFFAERHTTESNFRIDTSIACFSEVDPPG